MAKASHAIPATVTGTMLWANLNKLKHSDWEVTVLANNRSEYPFQTYLLQNQSRTRHKEEEYWWTFQSNVYGIVIAANSLAEEDIPLYPRAVDDGRKDPIIEHFIPNVTIVASDFREIASTSAEKKLDILDCLHKDKRVLYDALHQAMICFRKTLQERGAVHKVLSRAQRCLDYIATASESCETEPIANRELQVDIAEGQRIPEGELDVEAIVLGAGCIQSQRTVTALQQAAEELKNTHDPQKSWESTPAWVINNKRIKLIHKSDVGVLAPPTPSTTMILSLLEQELKTCLQHALKRSPIRGGIMCMEQGSRSTHAVKRARTEKSQTSLALNINYDKRHNTVFKKESIVNSVVWLIRYENLLRLVHSGAKEIFAEGECRVVTGQSGDKRLIHVQPPLEKTGEESSEGKFMCILFADIHQYLFLYENFKATAKRFQSSATNSTSNPALQVATDNVFTWNQWKSARTKHHGEQVGK